MFAQVHTCAAAIRARCRTFRAPQKFSSRLPCSNVPKGYLILASNTVDLSLHVLDFVQTEGYTVDSSGWLFFTYTTPVGVLLVGPAVGLYYTTNVSIFRLVVCGLGLLRMKNWLV